MWCKLLTSGDNFNDFPESTDQTESLGGGAKTLGVGTPDTLGFGPFRLNFIAAYRPTRFGCELVVGAVPSQPPKIREEKGFALNDSTTYRLRSTVLHTKVTRNG